MPEHAVQAYSELNGTFFHGRMFHLLPAKVDESKQDLDEDESNLNYKQKKELKLKKTAQSSHNWNTLFMGENAIAEVVAKKYGKTKEEVLSTEGGTTSAAVRLALGETEIVSEMRQFLVDNGIHLDAFNGVPKARSNSIIIAKNLPAGTEIDELKQRFDKFGLLGRVVLPPSGVSGMYKIVFRSSRIPHNLCMQLVGSALTTVGTSNLYFNLTSGQHTDCILSFSGYRVLGPQ